MFPVKLCPGKHQGFTVRVGLGGHWKGCTIALPRTEFSDLFVYSGCAQLSVLPFKLHSSDLQQDLYSQPFVWLSSAPLERAVLLSKEIILKD